MLSSNFSRQDIFMMQTQSHKNNGLEFTYMP
jgi:hypothetical protein